ncbi:MAG: PEP-CTERM sorting domain-containing protein [Sedimentisphaerales bacterium]
MKKLITICAVVMIIAGMAQAGIWFTMPGDTLSTTGNWEMDEEFSFKIMTDATAAVKYPKNAYETELGLTYSNFEQFGSVTISGSIAGNTLNLDNASYMEIGLITKAAVEKSEAWWLSGMFNDSVFMLISTNSSGQYKASAGDYNMGGGRWSSAINFDKTQDLSYELVLNFSSDVASLRIDNGAGWSSQVTVTFGIDDWTAAYPDSYGYLSPENFTQAALFANLYNEGAVGDMDTASFGNIAVTPEPATIAVLSLGGLLLRRKK